MRRTDRQYRRSQRCSAPAPPPQLVNHNRGTRLRGTKQTLIARTAVSFAANDVTLRIPHTRPADAVESETFTKIPAGVDAFVYIVMMTSSIARTLPTCQTNVICPPAAQAVTTLPRSPSVKATTSVTLSAVTLATAPLMMFTKDTGACVTSIDRSDTFLEMLKSAKKSRGRMVRDDESTAGIKRNSVWAS